MGERINLNPQIKWKILNPRERRLFSMGADSMKGKFDQIDRIAYNLSPNALELRLSSKEEEKAKQEAIPLRNAFEQAVESADKFGRRIKLAHFLNVEKGLYHIIFGVPVIYGPPQEADVVGKIIESANLILKQNGQKGIPNLPPLPIRV